MAGKRKAAVLAIGSIKGGCGKTATAGALAQAAASCGQKVLAIDLDPQACLSFWLNGDLTRESSFDVIEYGAEAAAAIQQTEIGIDLICAHADLMALTARHGSAKRLEAAIAPILMAYDWIIIDTAPQMGEAQNNALYAAGGLVIPTEPDGLNLQALYQMVDIAHHIQDTGSGLRFMASIVTKYDPRPRINKAMFHAIEQRAEEIGAPCLAAIRNGIAIREAMTLQQDLYTYAPKSKPAADYMDLFNGLQLYL